ncbi:MAG: ATP-grasp domain-containing protein [Gemmataceae bacterium]
MRLFIYEMASAGGLGEASAALRGEGWAMLGALVEDFMQVPGVEVVTLLDTGAERALGHVCHKTDSTKEREAFRAAARDADLTLVVAPEFDDLLAGRSAEALANGGRLLGSAPDRIRCVADKANLACVLQEAGVRTPPIVALLRPGDEDRLDPDPLTYPLVCKPRFGAGCLGLTRIDGAAHLARAVRASRSAAGAADLLLQPLISGCAASAAFLVGDGAAIPLRAGRQSVIGFEPCHGHGIAYRGGEAPLPAPLEERALRLATRALSAFPNLRGYAGVDLVLGSAPDGDEDHVIEINPRVTTAYVGLRRLCRDNIAVAWLNLTRGMPVAPRWRPGRVRFTSDGAIESIPETATCKI